MELNILLQVNPIIFASVISLKVLLYQLGFGALQLAISTIIGWKAYTFFIIGLFLFTITKTNGDLMMTQLIIQGLILYGIFKFELFKESMDEIE